MSRTFIVEYIKRVIPEKDKMREKARQKRGPRLSGKERALLIYRKNQQLALNAVRERERAELMDDGVGPISEGPVENANYGMSGL